MDGFNHRYRIGKARSIRIDEATESRYGQCCFYQLRIRVILCGIPFLAATFEQPHAADVLQEAGSSFHTAFVGEVLGITVFVDDGILYFDTHQAPGTRTEVGKLFVLGGYSGYGRCSIVSGYGYHRYSSETGHLLDFFGQCADWFTREYKASPLFFLHAHYIEQFLFELLGAWIQDLRSGGDGIFGHHLSGKHVAECIGHEQNLVGSFQSRAVVLAQGGQLEERVEVHELDAGNVVHLFLGDVGEVFFHGAHGVRVAVAIWIAEQTAIFTNKYKVYPPGVDTDGLDGDAFFGYYFQTFDDFIVECINIPIEMSSGFNDMIGKAGEFP